MHDAEQDGMPKEYAQQYIRKYTPERAETDFEQNTIMLRMPYVMATPQSTDWTVFGSGKSVLDKSTAT